MNHRRGRKRPPADAPAESVEDFLARGGTVTKVPAAGETTMALKRLEAIVGPPKKPKRWNKSRQKF